MIDLSIFGSFITSNLGLTFIIYLTMSFAIMIFQVADFIIWIIKQKLRIKNCEPIKYISNRYIKIRARILMFPLAIVIVILLFISVQAFTQKDFVTISLISFIILNILLEFVPSYLLQKVGFSGTFKMLAFVFIEISLLTLLLLLAILK